MSSGGVAFEVGGFDLVAASGRTTLLCVAGRWRAAAPGEVALVLRRPGAAYRFRPLASTPALDRQRPPGGVSWQFLAPRELVSDPEMTFALVADRLAAVELPPPAESNDARVHYGERASGAIAEHGAAHAELRALEKQLVEARTAVRREAQARVEADHRAEAHAAEGRRSKEAQNVAEARAEEAERACRVAEGSAAEARDAQHAAEAARDRAVAAERERAESARAQPEPRLGDRALGSADDRPEPVRGPLRAGREDGAPTPEAVEAQFAQALARIEALEASRARAERRARTAGEEGAELAAQFETLVAARDEATERAQEENRLRTELEQRVAQLTATTARAEARAAEAGEAWSASEAARQAERGTPGRDDPEP